jgi:hypothetical protein
VADVVLLLIVFSGLAVLSTTFEESARQFPQVFLYAGLVALGIQLTISLLPERYSKPIKRYTSGLADDMELGDESEEEYDEHDGGRTLSSSESSTDADEQWAELRRLGVVLGLVVGYFIAAYLVGFLLATPMFVFATMFTFGSRDYFLAALLSVLFVGLVYLLFGELMNVPIMEGIILP